jgi:RNA polymerase sigma factor for flagellar operon FliA
LSAEDRHCLILEHLPQVHLLARRIHGRLPESVSLDDLVSTGVVGLISAVDRFDPTRHVQLTTYASHKITGRILDSLRDLDWASRHLRKRAKQIETASTALEQRLHRSATEQEIATELNITIDRYREWRVRVRGLNLERLEAEQSDDFDKRDTRRPSVGNPNELPSAALERSELERVLATAISGLPEIHQTVISLHYREELRLREISKIVGMKESRISRIRSQAIRQLRACMAKLWPPSGGQAFDCGR